MLDDRLQALFADPASAAAVHGTVRSGNTNTGPRQITPAMRNPLGP